MVLFVKLSFDWLNDFVPFKEIPFSNFYNTILTSICEVDEVEEWLPFLDSVIPVRIDSLEPHPDAEKLLVAKCFDGIRALQIITGATNLKVDDLVPLALPGTQLPGQLIQESRVRGILSSGMMCSQKELGLGEDDSRVWILENLALGISLRKQMGQDDKILHIDNKSITHRPDLWSHFGFAREVGAQLGMPIQWNPLQATEFPRSTGSDGIQVTTTSHAHSYTATSIRNVSIQRSNEKIRLRLMKCGFKSINNIVDVSNYLLLECGQPTHFFDREKVTNCNFYVEPLGDSQTISLLDDSTPKIPNGTLMVWAGAEPVVLAGVMGGKSTAVQPETRHIILESAVFPRESVRSTIRKTGIRSESAVRYEKGLDRTTTLSIVRRALSLLKENHAGEFECFESMGFENILPPVVIDLPLHFLELKLGLSLEKIEIEEILKHLGFRTEDLGDKLRVEVPSYRSNYDVTIPEDLVEEIGRTIGYAKIPRRKLNSTISPPIVNSLRILERTTKGFFSERFGFSEVFNYSFTDPNFANLSATKDEIIGIKNPMPSELSVLRTSLFPGLAKQAMINQDRFPEVKLFEIGRTYFKESKEKRILSVFHLISNKSNNRVDLEKEFLIFRDQILEFLNKLGVATELKNYHSEFFHPNASLAIEIRNKMVGSIGILNSKLQEKWELRRRVFLAELDLEVVQESLEKGKEGTKFKVPSNFPNGELDISLVLKEREDTSQYLIAVKAAAIVEISDSYVESVFRSESIGNESKSVTYRFQLISYDKTFTQERLKEISDKLVQIANQIGYLLR